MFESIELESGTIVSYYKERRLEDRVDPRVWKELPDNEFYEVSDNYDIREIGKKYALSPRKEPKNYDRYGKKGNESGGCKVGIFGGTPFKRYFVDPVIEHDKVFPPYRSYSRKYGEKNPNKSKDSRN